MAQENIEGDEEEEENDSEGEESEEADHDEVILGNATDLIITLSSIFGDSFLPYFKRLGPKIVSYISDDHDMSEIITAIGCLAEVFNNCPSTAAPPFFEPFMQILIKYSGT